MKQNLKQEAARRNYPRIGLKPSKDWLENLTGASILTIGLGLPLRFLCEGLYNVPHVAMASWPCLQMVLITSKQSKKKKCLQKIEIAQNGQNRPGKKKN